MPASSKEFSAVYFIRLPSLSLISALPFPLQLLLKFIIKMIVYVDCVSFQDSMHLLRIKALGLTWQISVIQLCVFYFRNSHWLITFETPVRMLNSFFFFHPNSYSLPHRTSTWDHLEILSRCNLFQQSKWIWGRSFFVNVQMYIIIPV